jgi:hypothetical protein
MDREACRQAREVLVQGFAPVFSGEVPSISFYDPSLFPVCLLWAVQARGCSAVLLSCAFPSVRSLLFLDS